MNKNKMIFFSYKLEENNRRKGESHIYKAYDLHYVIHFVKVFVKTDCYEAKDVGKSFFFQVIFTYIYII